MPGLLQRLMPREEGFFDLFAKQAENIHDGAEALLKMLSLHGSPRAGADYQGHRA